MTRIPSALLMGMFAFALAAGCSTVSGWFGGGGGSAPLPPGSQGESLLSGASIEECRQDLEKLVAAHVNEQLRQGNSSQPALIHKRPYYYREYVEYPDPDNPRIIIRENDTKTRPLSAEVTLDKIRFSTQMHRSANNAREDGRFFRDTGVEKLNYELRNGRWRRVGSIYVAEKTEEFVNGSWVPREEEVSRVNPNEQPGWFRRTWTKIFGGDTE